MSESAEQSQHLTYRAAGVDIDAGNELVERIKGASAATRRKEVLGNLGGFGALCKIPGKYQSPVLVSGTDGVGTKLKLAIESGVHNGVGIDLVAMCVNDLLVTGAEPLFFLDYYATASLDVDVAESVIKSIASGCQMAGAALIGGETAEMPGMYKAGDYDLAGFCVGVVEEDRIIDGQTIADGDAIIGLASSGPHSNGYSLIRKVLEISNSDLQTPVGSHTLADLLLAPTRIYVKPVLALMELVTIKGMAHITGGGLTENLPRVLPDNIIANIDLASWELPEIFSWLQEKGNIASDEMLRTFNCGIGMALIVPADQCNQALEHLNNAGESAFIIGRIASQENSEPSVEYSGSWRT